MTYLIDSDWVADWLAGNSEAVQLLSTLTEEETSISLITFGEIYEGIYFSRDPEKSEAIFHRFLRGVPVVALTQRIMQRFARIRGQLRQQGQLISDPDLLIAATAVDRDLTLVTRNRKHFERIPELKLHPAD